MGVRAKDTPGPPTNGKRRDFPLIRSTWLWPPPGLAGLTWGVSKTRWSRMLSRNCRLTPNFSANEQATKWSRQSGPAWNLLKKTASTHLPWSQIMLSLQRSLSELISLPTSALRLNLTFL